MVNICRRYHPTVHSAHNHFIPVTYAKLPLSPCLSDVCGRLFPCGFDLHFHWASVWAPFVCVSTLGLDFVHFIVRFLVTVVELLYVFRIPFPNQYMNANTFSHPTDSFLLHGQYSSYEVQLPWFSFGFLCFRYHIPHHSKPQVTMFCLPCFPSIV